MRERIDRYELRGALGQGAIGIVYLAYDTKLAREVALKVIAPEVAANPAARQLFHREARAISMLRHPNIIALHDYSGADSDVVYIVVERLHGQTLLDMVEKRGQVMDAATAAAAVYEICLALDHAHQNGILHRDLKPENICLEPDGRIVLCDFGIARDYLSGMQNTLASQKTTLAGSPLYMSPEQILTPQKVGPQSDLFSLGSILYFLTSGAHAFYQPTMPKVLKAVSSAKFQPLDQARTDVPTPFAAIVQRLLQREPEKRFASAKQLGHQLEAFVRASAVHEPRNALRMLAQRGHATTSVIPLSELSQNPRHTTVLLRQKKAEAVIVEDGPPLPQELLSTAEIGKTLLRPGQMEKLRKQGEKPRSLGVLLWAMIAAIGIVVFGLLVAEVDAMGPVRAFLQHVFGK